MLQVSDLIKSAWFTYIEHVLAYLNNALNVTTNPC